MARSDMSRSFTAGPNFFPKELSKIVYQNESVSDQLVDVFWAFKCAVPFSEHVRNFWWCLNCSSGQQASANMPMWLSKKLNDQQMNAIGQRHFSSAGGALSHHGLRIGHPFGLGVIQRFLTLRVFGVMSIKKMSTVAGNGARKFVGMSVIFTFADASTWICNSSEETAHNGICANRDSQGASNALAVPLPQQFCAPSSTYRFLTPIWKWMNLAWHHNQLSSSTRKWGTRHWPDRTQFRCVRGCPRFQLVPPIG
jgi:hypothetical protein